MDWTGATGVRRLQHVRPQILAHWAWARLDREIAAGLSITESEARQLHARQLLCPEERCAIAAVLRNTLDAANAEARRSGVKRRTDAGAIVASGARLEQLIQLLRSEAPMAVRAVARAELLACDSHSPLRSARDVQAIVRALDEIDTGDAS